jgi:hypothetical protein
MEYPVQVQSWRQSRTELSYKNDTKLVYGNHTTRFGMCNTLMVISSWLWTTENLNAPWAAAVKNTND